MKLWIVYPLCMALGSAFMWLMMQTAKFLPDWAYFGLWLLVLPGLLGWYIDVRRSRKRGQR